MTGVLDETWTTFPSYDGELGVRTGGDVVVIDAARARLIAEAPLMARMLLEREWDDAGGHCAWCRRSEHHDDCAWLALMKRLGER